MQPVLLNQDRDLNRLPRSHCDQEDGVCGVVCGVWGLWGLWGLWWCGEEEDGLHCLQWRAFISGIFRIDRVPIRPAKFSRRCDYYHRWLDARHRRWCNITVRVVVFWCQDGIDVWLFFLWLWKISKTKVRRQKWGGAGRSEASSRRGSSKTKAEQQKWNGAKVEQVQK